MAFILYLTIASLPMMVTYINQPIHNSKSVSTARSIPLRGKATS